MTLVIKLYRQRVIKKIFITLCLFLFLPQSISFAQGNNIYFKSSLMLEASIPKIREDRYELDSYKNKYDFISESFHYSPLILFMHYSFKMDYYGNILELRPGISFGGDYMGLETGLFYRREISGGVYGLIGLNLHYNIDITLSNSRNYKVEDGCYYNPVFGFGIKIMKNFSFVSSLEYVKERKIYSSYSHADNYNPNSQNYRYLYWLLKLGVEYNL